jgi:hypothetical protein
MLSYYLFKIVRYCPKALTGTTNDTIPNAAGSATLHIANPCMKIVTKCNQIEYPGQTVIIMDPNKGSRHGRTITGAVHTIPKYAVRQTPSENIVLPNPSVIQSCKTNWKNC